MASKTKRTELKRKARDSREGRRRKARLNTQGSTKSAAKLFGDE